MLRCGSPTCEGALMNQLGNAHRQLRRSSHAIPPRLWAACGIGDVRQPRQGDESWLHIRLLRADRQPGQRYREGVELAEGGLDFLFRLLLERDKLGLSRFE